MVTRVVGLRLGGVPCDVIVFLDIDVCWRLLASRQVIVVVVAQGRIERVLL